MSSDEIYAQIVYHVNGTVTTTLNPEQKGQSIDPVVMQKELGPQDANRLEELLATGRVRFEENGIEVRLPESYLHRELLGRYIRQNFQEKQRKRT